MSRAASASVGLSSQVNQAYLSKVCRVVNAIRGTQQLGSKGWVPVKTQRRYSHERLYGHRLEYQEA
jgi:hypothetical protein